MRDFLIIKSDLKKFVFAQNEDESEKPKLEKLNMEFELKPEKEDNSYDQILSEVISNVVFSLTILKQNTLTSLQFIHYKK